MQPLPAPGRGEGSSSNGARDQNRQQSVGGPAASQAPTSTLTQAEPPTKKKRRHRGGKKRRNRRQSFAAPSEASAVTSVADADGPADPMMQAPVPGRDTYYRRGTIGNLSEESLASEALLDHRYQPQMRTRRESRASPMIQPNSHRSGFQPPLNIGSPHYGHAEGQVRRRRRSQQGVGSYESLSEHDEDATDRTPLLTRSPVDTSYGLSRVKSHNSALSAGASQAQTQQRRRGNATNQTFPNFDSEYDINNPPSMPNSPQMRPRYEDVMVGEGDFLPRSPDSRRNLPQAGKDAVINIDSNGDDGGPNSAPPSPRRRPEGFQLHRSVTFPGEEDVCFPADAVSELGDEEYEHLRQVGTRNSVARRRNRRQEWPQLWVLDDWSREEKEQRAGERRSKKLNEPIFVDGRLRPAKHAWHRVEEEMPYRYTYFNEEFESTIHAQTISELIQPGGNFRELFIPDPPELSDSSESEEEDLIELNMQPAKPPQNKESKDTKEQEGLLSPKSQVGTDQGGITSNIASRLNSMVSTASKEPPAEASSKSSAHNSAEVTPQQESHRVRRSKQKKYGPRPTFWLDVMCPTDQEMRVLCKTFGIHALTSEDIMVQEAREKVELFRHYYFINYRTFEQDSNSEDYLEPINMYVCVFRYGIISFHFSQIPHPANVRRRIRQLSDYLILSADWISYAIIDDITDVYQPLITSIEEEVDDIDELILKAFQSTQALSDGDDTKSQNEKDGELGSSGFDMLRRIGECRKKVMSLYRLLGTKADVIKGFAKRCNEQWEVAPKSEIGLYLGDIQDHILTMTSNLSHYETLLSRAHSNYLAQVNIRMNERSEQTADVLGKLTVVGTIVLPMNIICGMWGMNVKVPGQEIDNLYWFWSITAGLILFAVICFYICRKVYGI